MAFSPFCLLFLSLLLSVSTLANNVTFDSASFSFSNLTLLGDSSLRNSLISLTKETSVPLSSAGSVISNLPIQFFDPLTNTSASFSTKFSFFITNQNSESFGDGLTFFISPNNNTLGGTGGLLGIFNSNGSSGSNGSVIAVEFDTRLNEEFNDTSDNHLGLDIGSPISITSVDLGQFGVDLKSGNLTTVWIDYNNEVKNLSIWLSYRGIIKPNNPIFSINIDLSPHFIEFMYAGFSASTLGSTELHTIKDWEFKTFGFPSLNLSSNSTQNISNISPSTIPNISVNNNTQSNHKKRLGLTLGILGPVALCVAFILFAWVTIKKLIEFTKNKEGFASEVLKGPRKFTYKELSLATKGFNTTRIIGKGAFGTVFKAVMPGGSGIIYAVKRAKHEHQCKSEFVSELSIIACLRHKNLVQLEGWCDEKNELLLVYEYMANGSLDKILYNSDPGSVFNWTQRYNVAIGLASALSYLHQECEQRVIHRDIKTGNVLLDINFNPRLGDFGLARLMDHNKSPVSTLTAGTMGYLAPEYLQYGKATEKTDVFSYGVVVLEVCCGRRPIDKEDFSNKKTVNLVDWVWKLYSEDKLIEAADRRLNGEFSEEEMVRLLLVGLSCANPNCVERPSMRRVFQILSGEAEAVRVPRKKPLLVFCSSLSMKEIIGDGELEQIKIE